MRILDTRAAGFSEAWAAICARGSEEDEGQVREAAIHKALAASVAGIDVIVGGHDHFAYENPNFRQILRQAIRWTAKKG